MMFSTKAEYGVRVMAHLAARDGGPPVSLGAIAQAEALPLAYLEHLVQRLRRAGLVDSRRGAHGGYSLARPAGAISMAAVVRALEGDIAPIECISERPDGRLVCSREAETDHACPTKLLWTRVQGSIVRTLTELTLSDIAPAPKETGLTA
jgi:Rrf2 family protein